MAKDKDYAEAMARAVLRGSGIPTRPNEHEIPCGVCVVPGARRQFVVSGDPVDEEWDYCMEVYFQREYCGLIYCREGRYQSADLEQVYHSYPAPVILYLAAFAPQHADHEDNVSVF